MATAQERIPPDPKQNKGYVGGNIKKKAENPKPAKKAGGKQKASPSASKTSIPKISKGSATVLENPDAEKSSGAILNKGTGVNPVNKAVAAAKAGPTAKGSATVVDQGSSTSVNKGTSGVTKPPSSTSGKIPPTAKTSGTGISKGPGTSKIPKSTSGLSKKPSGGLKSTASKDNDSGGPPSEEPSTSGMKPISSPANDVLNTEFIYYSAVLRNYALILTREYDKVTTHLWMKKLFKPEYHSTVLKPKRNKYLLYLAITIFNDETYGIFRGEPPRGVLPEISNIPFNRNFPPAAWELEKQWPDTVADLPEDLKISYCYLHENGCPQPCDNARPVLDASFQFYLWLIRPYVALLTDMEDKTMVACWIQLLCGIAADENDCVEMKELRNEYMQALLGYVHDLRVEGPFRLMPPVGPIPPLSALYDACEDPDNTPAAKKIEEFLKNQPVPDNGAFAYINVTGELFGTV